MTDTPRCSRCHAPMEFQRIDPGIKGYENHVYECGRCYTMTTESVSLAEAESMSAKPAIRVVRPTP